MSFLKVIPHGAAERFLPVSAHTFMLCVGVVEMAVGLAILTRWSGIDTHVDSIALD